MKRFFSFRRSSPTPKSSGRPSTLVAVTWDHDELLALVARARAESLELLHTLRVTVSDEETAKEACAQLATQLRDLRLGRYDLLVGVPRSLVEMRSLQLPPGGAAEFPMMVRNEMLRQVPDLAEETPIDYFSPSDAAVTSAGPLEVEAAALRPECVAWIKGLSDALQAKPARILLRTQSLMALFFRQVASLPRRSLLLNLVGGAADLSVLAGRRVTFSRTVRAATESGGPVDLVYLADEIRRTLFVAPRDETDEEGAELEHVYMFANLDRNSQFVEHLADELSGSVSLLDPMAGVQPAPGSKPENAHQLAVLLGMAWEHVTNSVELDFANPKKPPEPVRRGRKLAFYGVAATAALAIVASTFYSDVQQAKEAVADLSEKVALNKKLLNRLDQKMIIIDAVHQWEKSQVDWLNEFQRLSHRLPVAEKAVVQRLTMAGSGDAGVVSLSLKVRDPGVLAETEDGLRDVSHQVSSQRITQADSGSAYPCQFETTIVVRPTPPATRNPSTTSPVATR